MGYGGIFKTIVRVVATTVGGIACGPPCAAIGSAVATGATGGSFKDALMSGATAYIGASITQGINASIGDAAAANAGSTLGTTPVQIGGAAGEFGGVGVSNAASTIGEVAGSTAINSFSPQVATTFSPYTPYIGGNANLMPQELLERAFVPPEADMFAAVDPVQSGAAFVNTGPTIPAPEGNFLNTIGLGGVAETLTDPTAGINPLITDANAAINAGISKFPGTAFGKVGDVTRSSFDFFKDMGNKVLGPGGLNLDLTPLQIANTGDLIGAGIGGLTTLTLDQALAMDLPGLDETLGQAFGPEQIAALRQEQRNALSQRTFDRLISETENPFDNPEEFNKVIAGGIERANTGLGPDVTEQQFSAVFDDPSFGTQILDEEERLRRQSFNQDIGAAFPGDSFQSLDDEIISSIVEERRGPAQAQVATQEARGNLNPFGGQTANQFLSGQEPRIRERIGEIGEGVLGTNREAVGAIRDRASQAVRGAIAEGGRTQGLVSGSPNQGFLDTIAAREQAGTRQRRGLGSRGSGAF